MDSQASDALSIIDSDQFNDVQSHLSSAIAVGVPPQSQSVTSQATSPAAGISQSRKLWTLPIWDYTKVGRFDLVVNARGKETWNCKLCSKEYIVSGGTGIIVAHLKTSHSINIKAARDSRTSGYEYTIQAAFARPQSIEQKRQKLNSTRDGASLDPKILEDLYIRWIVACGISFQMVSILEFRTLLYYLNPDANQWLPNSHTIIHSWLIRTYKDEKIQVQQTL
jgi:hypothetical protein